jgi:Methyltransferase domain
MTPTPIKHGNFDSLAGDYAQYRPGYAPSIVPAILALVGRPPREIDAVDIGSGTGTWIEMLAAQELRSVTAIEPNDEMRRNGLMTSQEHHIVWRRGTTGETHLAPRAYDLVSMRLGPAVKRVSSRRSGLTDRVTNLLWAKRGFEDVVDLEGRHVATQTVEQYLGACSVNDLRVQLGPDLLSRFLQFVERKTAAVAKIETTYLTRTWARHTS